jgi:hypothetical protein
MTGVLYTKSTPAVAGVSQGGAVAYGQATRYSLYTVQMPTGTWVLDMHPHVSHCHRVGRFSALQIERLSILNSGCLLYPLFRDVMMLLF